MNPVTWKEMISRARELELSLGVSKKDIQQNEKGSVLVQRRSIRLKTDIPKGKKLNKNDFIMLRPISKKGFPPYRLNEFVGKLSKKKLVKGEEILKSHILKNVK